MVGGGVDHVAAVDSLVVDVNLQISSTQATATINNKKGGQWQWHVGNGRNCQHFLQRPVAGKGLKRIFF
jgi:hypothetical protein